MRTKAAAGFLSSLFTIVIALSLIPVRGQCSGYTVDEVQGLIDGIIAYKLESTGSGSVQEWIDDDLAAGAGTTSEWYIASLSQDRSCDLSSYEASLREYLKNNNVPSATSREKYALCLSAAGSTDPYMADILEGSVGKQGIMSWIYGLHVLNNGYTCQSFDENSVVDTLLSLQYPDGGWAIFGGSGDIDVTAMTISALAPHCDRSDVDAAVDRGLNFLSQRQETDGGYISFGTPNTESTAQVLLALSSLGIDCQDDERFIKDGHDLIDGMMQYRLPDGSFSHTSDGVQNESATVQALYSLISYKRMLEGGGPFWVFDNRRPVREAAAPVESKPAEQGQGTRPPSGGTAPAETPVSPGNGAVTTSPQSSSVAGTGSTSLTKMSQTTSAASTSASATVSDMTAETSGEITSAEGTELTSGEKKLSSDTESGNTGKKKKNGYKVKAVIVIVTAAGVLCLVIFAAGKRNYKNFIAVGAAAAVAVVIVMMTDIQSKDEYYNGEKVHKENAIGTVTMTIRCDTIADKSDSEFVPDDGVILDVTEFDLDEGETVFDILTEAARTYHIQVENKGSAGSAHGMVYISGINYIYEMEYGDLSGWVYHVNGITPSRNCGEYVLKDGDFIEWLYTCELGHDLDEVYEE